MFFTMIKEKDFIEIDFVGKVKGGDVFDSTKKEDLEHLHQGHDHKLRSKPLVISVGNGMFMKALDEFLIGKEVGKDYEIELQPQKAFGKRNPKEVQTMPSKVFKDQKVPPSPGAVFNFDGKIGRILTVSGGRVIVDFNHSLAGKEVIYKIKVLRKVEDINEKVKALNEFFFRKDFDFEIKGKKLIIDADDSYKRFIELFKDKFKEILDLNVEIKSSKKEDAKDNKN